MSLQGHFENKLCIGSKLRSEIVMRFYVNQHEGENQWSRLNSEPVQGKPLAYTTAPDHALLKVRNTVFKERRSRVRRKKLEYPQELSARDYNFFGSAKKTLNLLYIYENALHHSARFRLAPFICILSL